MLLKTKKIQVNIINLLPLLICIVALILRLYRLDSNSLWYDEISAFYRIVYASSAKSLIIFDNHPPLYYWCLNIWMKLLGDSDWWLRFFSVCCNILALGILYYIVCDYQDRKTANLAILFFALSPFQLFYSQEVRMYSCSLFLVMLNALFFLRLIYRRHKNHYINLLFWILYGISLYAGVMSLYYVYFYLAAQIIIVLFQQFDYRNKIKFILVILFVIFISTLNDNFNSSFSLWAILGHRWLVEKVNLFKFLRTFSVYSLGYQGTPFSDKVITILYGVVLFYFFGKYKRKYFLIICLAILPPLFAYIVSHYLPIYLYRNLLPFSPFFYIIIALGVRKIKIRMLKIVIVLSYCLLLVLSLFQYYCNYSFYMGKKYDGVHLKKTIKPVINYVLSNLQNDEAIAYANPSVKAEFSYYCVKQLEYNNYVKLKRWAKIFEQYSGKTGVKKLPFITFYLFYPRADIYFERIMKFSFQEGTNSSVPVNVLEENLSKFNINKLWVLLSSWDRNGNLSYNDEKVLAVMMKRYNLLSVNYLQGVYIYKFLIK